MQLPLQFQDIIHLVVAYEDVAVRINPAELHNNSKNPWLSLATLVSLMLLEITKRHNHTQRKYKKKAIISYVFFSSKNNLFYHIYFENLKCSLDGSSHIAQGHPAIE